MSKMFKSKRFVVLCLSVVLFLLLIYTTSFAPMEIAGSIATITSVYITAQSIRGSSKTGD